MTAVVSGLLVLLGAGVVLLGALGLVRLPDFFSRLHAAGTVDTLGAWLVLAGLLLAAPALTVAFKLLLMAALLGLLSPVVSHAMARSALADGVDDGGEDGGEDGVEDGVADSGAAAPDAGRGQPASA